MFLYHVCLKISLLNKSFWAILAFEGLIWLMDTFMNFKVLRGVKSFSTCLAFILLTAFSLLAFCLVVFKESVAYKVLAYVTVLF